MKLPNHQHAIVTQSKVVLYLLNETHPKGKSKAKFFRRFGFLPAQWEALAEALRRHAADYEVVTLVESALSIQYTIEGDLQTPNRRNPFIRSVWAIDHGDLFAHLVTAYPIDKD